jgi:6-phosphofructokinase 1
MKKIALLTSGGDAPGMNACIRAIVRTAIYKGLTVYGVQRGYQGMVDNKIIPMDSRSVSNIIQRGGTILKTSRSKDFLTEEGRRQAFYNLQDKGVEGLVVIGGNGTYTGANVFYKEFGMPVIGIPGTIDNDLYGTDYTIGYDTAINTALEAIDKIRDTADSFDRTFFVEVMGRDAGFIAVDVGISGGAEAILVPEMHTDVTHLVEILQKGWGRKKGSQLIIVAEGEDAGGVYHVVEKIRSQVPSLDARVVVLGHIQRGGAPTARDRVLASRLGAAAVNALIEGKTNQTIGVINDKLHYCTFEEAVTRRKPVNNELLALGEVLSQ